MIIYNVVFFESSFIQILRFVNDGQPKLFEIPSEDDVGLILHCNIFNNEFYGRPPFDPSFKFVNNLSFNTKTDINVFLFVI